MSEIKPLSDDDVQSFIDKLKQSDTDKKVDQIQFFGLTLEDASEISANALDGLTLTIAPLFRSSSQLLITSILSSFLPFYIPLLPAFPVQHLHLALAQLLPGLVERLNDPKERVHSAANACVALLGRKCYEAEPAATHGTSTSVAKGKEKEGLVGFWERHVRDTMTGKGWRGKVEAMKILLALRSEEKSRLSLKPWLSPLVDLLEDGDGNVRDQARETVVALLAPSSTPPAARMELKKLLQARNVRKGIADGILTRIFATDGPSPPPESSVPVEESTRSGAATPASISNEEIEVVHVASGKDLENEFAQMAPHFEGKETEHNWLPREKSLIRIRGLLRGQAHIKHLDSFLVGLKMGIAEGIAKTLLSLRTTVAQQACAVVLELAENLGSAYDHFVENLLPILARMAGFTKKIIAEKSQKCVTAIITHSTVHPRIFVAHITTGIDEKNIQTRQYSTLHLKTFIEAHAKRSKTTIENTPAVLDTIEAAVKKGLADVNPQVRESMRLAFWSFHTVWPSRAQGILESLDGTARKQLEKANPKGFNGSNGPTAATARPGLPKKPTASSAMSALLAEKRRAKAAELAAGRAAMENQRTVSSPIPTSPSVEPRLRSTSSQFLPTQAAPLQGPSMTPPRSRADYEPASPTPASSSSAPRNVPPPQQASPHQLLSRSRSSSLVKAHSQSPPSSRGSPMISKSPLGQSDTPTNPLLSDSVESTTPGKGISRTPSGPRLSLPRSEHASGLGVFEADVIAPEHSTNLSSTPGRQGSRFAPTSDPALQAQADQAESVARQLLDVDHHQEDMSLPVTPARSNTKNTSNGRSPRLGGSSNFILKTPINKFLNGASPSSSRAPWEDSPRPEAMTPLLFAQLKERKHERTWWLKRQELMDKASPLKSVSADPVKAISPDIQELEDGSPSLRALQKLALFVEEHPLVGEVEDVEANEKVWKESRVFDRIFDGLMSFLDPRRPIELLEQGLVLLWEMVRNQWALFEDRDDALVDALFRLRASSNLIIHESVNSLISLLCEVSEPLFFSAVLQSALKRYLASHPADAPATTGVSKGADARSSGYLFGLTGIGMCVLRMPVEVVRIEAPQLAPLISEALSQEESISRRAANVLILAIQAVMMDSQATLGMLDLTEYQKNLVVYLMEKNGLRVGANDLQNVHSAEAEEERREKVVGEMIGLLGKASRQ